jgi:hypothetical protein
MLKDIYKQNVPVNNRDIFYALCFAGAFFLVLLFKAVSIALLNSGKVTFPLNRSPLIKKVGTSFTPRS